jgi:hypothetical protein
MIDDQQIRLLVELCSARHRESHVFGGVLVAQRNRAVLHVDGVKAGEQVGRRVREPFVRGRREERLFVATLVRRELAPRMKSAVVVDQR